MSLLESYVGACLQAISQEDGNQLIKMLQIPDIVSNNNYLMLIQSISTQGPEFVPVWGWKKLVDGADITDIWREVVNSQLGLLLKVYTKAPVKEVYSILHAQIQAFFRIFQGDTKWTLPVLFQLCEFLWDRAKATENTSTMEEAARAINKAFTLCITDRNPQEDQSRKWGTCKIAGFLFRIYFYLGQLNLCNNVLKAIEASQLPAMGAFPAAHRVTFRYFLGRFHFVNERYQAAEEELALAFKQCHRKGKLAKRQILHLLIPCRLIVTGVIPSTVLLQRYQLIVFYPLALQFLRDGNVKGYQKLLESHEHDLLQMGTFGVWERLVMIAYRSLVRQIWRIDGEESRLSLGRIAMGLRLPPDNNDNLEEVGCIVANLIDIGLVKGYISQERATVVLSQKDPFAALTACKLFR